MSARLKESKIINLPNIHFYSNIFSNLSFVHIIIHPKFALLTFHTLCKTIIKNLFIFFHSSQ